MLVVASPVLQNKVLGCGFERGWRNSELRIRRNVLAGFDHNRVFYPTLVTVIATYYILFTVMGSSTPSLVFESRPTREPVVRRYRTRSVGIHP